jgi:hypothetical protein
LKFEKVIDSGKKSFGVSRAIVDEIGEEERLSTSWHLLNESFMFIFQCFPARTLHSPIHSVML